MHSIYSIRRRVLAVVMCFSLVAGQVLPSFADDATSETMRAAATTIYDIALRDGGVLTTRVVDLQGNPVVGEEVTVSFQGKVIATSVSDEDGLVAVRGLRPGVHTIETSTTVSACRF